MKQGTKIFVNTKEKKKKKGFFKNTSNCRLCVFQKRSGSLLTHENFSVDFDSSFENQPYPSKPTLKSVYTVGTTWEGLMMKMESKHLQIVYFKTDT